MSETRTVFDPFELKSIEISNRLVDRLRGKYASGPHLPNGNPEFGWRQFQAPPIQHEAAAEIEKLQAERDALKLNVEELSGQLDRTTDKYKAAIEFRGHTLGDVSAQCISELAARETALKLKVERLVKALRPFAEFIAMLDAVETGLGFDDAQDFETVSDGEGGICEITYGDLREADAAIKEAEQS